jgi:L-rhamnose mutarotase
MFIIAFLKITQENGVTRWHTKARCSMQRIAFIMRIKPGTEEEYRRRHRQVWPELLADLKRAGCRNYSIYLRGTELFAYMEVADFQRYLEIMASSQTSERWEAMMSDILIRETSAATGFPSVLEEVFHLD